MHVPQAALRVGVAVLLLTVATCASAADLDLAVLPGFDGHVKLGAWTPVTVVIANRGKKTSGELSIEGRGTYRRPMFSTPVELPANSNLAYTLYVLLEEVENNELSVVLQPRGARALVTKTVVKVHQPTDKLVLLLSRDPGGLPGASGLLVPVTQTPTVSQPGGWQGEYYGYGGPYPPPGAPYYEEAGGAGPAWTPTMPLPTGLADVLVAPFNATTATGAGGRLGLPDRAIGYHSVDVVVLHNFSVERLTKEQWAALQTWVRLGGTLVVCYAGAVADVQAPAERLLTTANSLAYRYGIGMLAVPPFVAASGPLVDGVTLAGSNDFPLLAERAYGCGRVIYLALDPTKQPLRSWPWGARELWRDLVLRGPSLRPAEFAPRYEELYGMQRHDAIAQALVKIPQMRAPSFVIVGLFLFLYVLCVVPINYLVLRRLDRREWAWVTVPAIVLMFTVGAYLAGYALKGGSVLYREASICSTRAGSPIAVRDGYFGIFSPARATYDVTLPRGMEGLAEGFMAENRGVSRYTLSLGSEFRLPDLLINMWDMRVFHSLGPVDMRGPLTASMELQRDGIHGRVTNRSQMAFRGACVLWRGTMAQVGQLPPGGSQEFHLPTTGGPQAQPYQVLQQMQSGGAGEMAEELVQAVLGQNSGLAKGLAGNELLLAAWAPDVPEMGVSVKPGPKRKVNGAMLLAVLPITDSSGSFDVPRSMTTARVVDADVKREDFQMLSGREMPEGAYVIEVALPLQGANLVFSRMNVLFEYQPRVPKSVSLSVFDWVGRQWRTLPTESGVNIRALPNPGRYVRLPDGTMRFRVDNDNDRQQPKLQNLTLTCTGTHR